MELKNPIKVMFDEGYAVAVNREKKNWLYFVFGKKITDEFALTAYDCCEFLKINVTYIRNGMKVDETQDGVSYTRNGRYSYFVDKDEIDRIIEKTRGLIKKHPEIVEKQNNFFDMLMQKKCYWKR